MLSIWVEAAGGHILASSHRDSSPWLARRTLRTADVARSLVNASGLPRCEDNRRLSRLKRQAQAEAFRRRWGNLRWRYFGLFYVAPRGASHVALLRIRNGILNHRQFAGMADFAAATSRIRRRRRRIRPRRSAISRSAAGCGYPGCVGPVQPPRASCTPWRIRSCIVCRGQRRWRQIARSYWRRPDSRRRQRCHVSIGPQDAPVRL